MGRNLLQQSTSVLKAYAFAVLLLLWTGSVFAQSTTITTPGTGNVTGSYSPCTTISFLVTNNNAYTIKVTDVGYSSSSSSPTALWYSATNITGGSTLSPPAWNQVANVPSPAVMGNTIIDPNFFSGLNVEIPSGATYKFVVEITPSTVRMSTSSGGIHTGGGVVLDNTTSCYGNCNGTNSSCTNYKFFGSITFEPAALPCIGVPTTEIQGPTEICPGKGFNLKPNPAYMNATYNWETSTDGGMTWTPFLGQVSQYGMLRDSITISTYYRLTIICNGSNLSFTTPPYLVKISEFYYCYCDNNSQSRSASVNKVNIGRVKISGMPAGDVRLDNITITGSQVNNGNADKDYSDFRRAVPPVRVYADSNFQIEVSQFNSGNALTNAAVLVFVDYDRDGIFQYYERVHGSTTLSAAVPGEVKATFKLSDTAHIGLTGMRVIINQGNGVPDSCGLYTNGETEDYLVDIRYDPCKGPVYAGIVEATDTSMCPGYMYGLTDTTYEAKLSEIAKLWQMSADDIVWNDIPGSEFKDTLQRIFDFNQPFYYRMRMVCDATDDTSYSAPVRVNNKAGYKCYCFSQSEGGLGVDTSDLGGLKLAGFDLQQGGSHLRNPMARYQRKDFTDHSPIDLIIDSTYTMNIAHTMPGSHHGDAKVTVFMDFNNNKVYDIPEDRVFMGFTSSGTFVLHPDIHIPSNAIANVPTGMRIIINNDIAPNAASDSACGTYLSGETEDYIVMFHRRFPANVNALDKLSDMQVYPNPTTGKFRVSFLLPGATEEVHITVTNVTGQKLFTNTYNHQGGRFSEEIDMNGAAPGVYFVELVANGQKTIERLTVR